MSVIIKDRTRIVISTPGPQGAAGSGSGSGTVTSITAGAGLTGGTITTSGTLAVSYGSAANTACEGNDARLSDARTPTSHTHTLSDLAQSGATTNQVATWNGSAWAPATPSGGPGSSALAETNTFEHVEHFLLGVSLGPQRLIQSTLNGGNIGNATVSNRPGVVNISTGASATSGAYLSWRMSNSASISDFGAVSSAVYTTEMLGFNLGNSTTTGIVAMGLARFVAGDATDGVYFRATDDGNWYAVTRNNSTETATDTGVAQDATTWHRFTCRYTSSSCTFYIDGTLKATHTTNIPTASLNYGAIVLKTAAVTGQIRYQVDYLYAALTYASAITVDGS